MKTTKFYWIFYTVGAQTKKRKTIEAYNKESAIKNLIMYFNYNNINNYKITKAIKVK